MGSPCIECGSRNTRLEKGDDGHFRKWCDDCGYVGGPYISSSILDDESTDPDGERGQASLTDY